MRISVLRRHQALRQFQRARPRRSRGELGRADCAARAVGLRQDDAAPYHRRPRLARCRRGPVRRRRRAVAQRRRAPRWLCVSALRAFSAHDGVREHRVRTARAAAPAAARRSGHPRAGEKASRPRSARLAGRALSVAAVRRPAPADCARPRTRRRTARPTARRTVRRARCQGAQGTAALAPQPPQRNSGHLDFRHARSGRGA